MTSVAGSGRKVSDSSSIRISVGNETAACHEAELPVHRYEPENELRTSIENGAYRLELEAVTHRRVL